ncbi:MAG: hypothetical protein GY696_22275, partial [Gammaproteobacteria bacterium]|nr:hypothetical protein [Gammaproteobacteria bacterium]
MVDSSIWFPRVSRIARNEPVVLASDLDDDAYWYGYRLAHETECKAELCHCYILRPIAFASKTLSSAERNYSTPERETLACVWAMEHFNHFLFGRKFTLRTDQSSLQTLLTRFGETRSSRRISRWYDRMRHYDYDVLH